MRYGIACNGLSNGGGMERYTLDLIKGLLQCHFGEIVVFSKKNGNDSLRIPNVNLVVIPTWFLPRFLREIYFSWRLKKLRKKFSIDVLISCCRVLGADVVCCGGTHLGYINVKKRYTLFDKLCIWMETKQFSGAKSIIAHSKKIEKELITLYNISQNKIRVLYPPVDLEKFRNINLSEKNKLKKLYGVDSKRITFLFVSTGHKRKGFNLLSTFFEETNLPVTLLVAGRPLPKGKKYKNINYIGYQSDIEKIYNVVDYVILASVYEPFGLAPFEAIACGTPVVISDSLGANEIINDDVKIVFKSQDIKSLESAIRRAIQEIDMMKEKLKNSSGIKKYDFSSEYHARQIFSLSNEIC